MKSAHGLVVILAIGAAITGCNKENYPAGVPVENPLRAIFEQNRTDANQAYVVDAAQGGTVFGAQGTIITVQPNAFRTNSGGMVSGPVTIQLLEAMGPAHMVGLNLQTVGIYGGQKRMLQSGGEVRVRAEANGQQVTVVDGEVVIHVPAAAGVDPLMQRFVGEEDQDGDMLWRVDGELDADTGGVVILDSAGGQGWVPGDFYSVPWPANTFGSTWPPFDFINCDHPLPPGGDSTDVTITVPQGFGNWTTSVWIVLPDINCMVYQEVWNGNSVRAGFPVRVG
ncbi:MAG: hypothetical protein WAU70_12195, partial [Flavobacteriales bacterium]